MTVYINLALLKVGRISRRGLIEVSSNFFHTIPGMKLKRIFPQPAKMVSTNLFQKKNKLSKPKIFLNFLIKTFKFKPKKETNS
mgnify:CR=1 FL=1